MRIHHIPVRITNARLDTRILDKYFSHHSPRELLLTATAQFLPLLDHAEAYFNEKGIRTERRKGRHTRVPGHVLGCDAPITYTGREKQPAQPIQTVFFIGDGLFHVKELLLQGADTVIAYIPHIPTIREYTRELIRKDEQHRKAGLAAFYHAKRVGVIISLKPGQQYYRFLRKLEEAYPDKTYYPIVFDTIDFSQLENFPFIEAFVNTACPRLMDDYEKFPRPVVNIRDLLVKENVQ